MGWAREHCDGLLKNIERHRENVMRELAELREGLSGQVGKSENTSKQVEKVVTHEQKQVEEVVTHVHRVGGVLWRRQSHVAKRRAHMRKSHMSKQFHLSNTTCSLFSKLDTVTMGLANTGETRSRHLCLKRFFFFFEKIVMFVHFSEVKFGSVL